MARPRPGLRIHVHEDPLVLDGMHALVDLANSDRTLEDRLCAMARLVAGIANVDVVSIYLREHRPEGDVLVMKGNVGFPPSAVGRVELGAADGLTGVVVQRRRPVTVAVAQADSRYKHVDGIGEEDFPAYLGVPLFDRDDVVGALVMQRREPSRFTSHDVTLATSLTAPFIFVIQREAEHRYVARSTLFGTMLVGGRAVGAATVLVEPNAVPQISEAVALQALELDLVTATQRLRHARSPQVARALENLRLVADVLREDSSANDVRVALDRVPYRTLSGEKALAALLEERRKEMGDLLGFVARDVRDPIRLAGRVLVTKRVGTFLALEAIARGASAVVAGEVTGPGAKEVLRAADVPTVIDVPELVSSVHDDEILDVDAAVGSVHVVESQS
jgi:signal transduction protein with GAF and PtsI domain